MTVLKNKKNNVRGNLLNNVNGGRLIRPKFQAFYKPSGVDNLDPNLTINGTTVEPMFRYKGGDANAVNWPAWGHGEDLSITGAGDLPILNTGSPLLGTNDDSVQINGGKSYVSSDSSIGDVTTEDLVYEMVFKTTPIGDLEPIFSKRESSGLYVGVYCYQSSTGRIAVSIDAGAATVSVQSDILSENTWYHCIIFINRDETNPNGTGTYINGVVSGSGDDMTPATASLTNIGYLRIGGNQAGDVVGHHNIAYFAAWKRYSWHQAGAAGPAEWATIAAERFARLCGYWPHIAAGTKLPTVKTRAFPAYLDKVESGNRKLYYVGGEWLRQCHRQDANGVNVRGYLPETQAENLFTYSEDFSTWDLIEAGTAVVDNAAVCPDGRTVAASIAGDSDDEQHGIEDVVTLTAATHAYSGFAMPGNKDWVYINNSTVANCDCYFDVANGTVGTSGANATGYIEGPFYHNTDAFYRWCIVFTGTAAAHTLQISPAQADTDNDFIGDGSTVNTYVWGAQCELGDYMTSPIITSGAAATRLQDQLQFVAGANIGGEDVGQGTVACDVLMSDYDEVGIKNIFSLSDGGASTDRIYSYIDSSGQNVAISAATSGNAGSSIASGDCADGEKHQVRTTWKANSLTAYLDGTPDSTPDNSCDMPDDIDRLSVGASRSISSQFNGLIQNIRIYDEPTEE